MIPWENRFLAQSIRRFAELAEYAQYYPLQDLIDMQTQQIIDHMPLDDYLMITSTVAQRLCRYLCPITGRMLPPTVKILLGDIGDGAKASIRLTDGNGFSLYMCLRTAPTLSKYLLIESSRGRIYERDFNSNVRNFHTNVFDSEGCIEAYNKFTPIFNALGVYIPRDEGVVLEVRR